MSWILEWVIFVILVGIMWWLRDEETYEDWKKYNDLDGTPKSRINSCLPVNNTFKIRGDIEIF